MLTNVMVMIFAVVESVPLPLAGPTPARWVYAVNILYLFPTPIPMLCQHTNTRSLVSPFQSGILHPETFTALRLGPSRQLLKGLGSVWSLSNGWLKLEDSLLFASY